MQYVQFPVLHSEMLFLISILRRANLKCFTIGLLFLPPLCLGDKVNADVDE